MNYLKISFLVLCIATFGCKKDKVVSIVNTYELIEAYTDDGQISIGIGPLKTTQNYTFTGEDYNVILTINEDNSFTSQGTYSQVLALEGVTAPGNPRNPLPDSGNCELDGDNLTFTSTNGSEVIDFEITTHTEEVLEGKYIKQDTEGLETEFATVYLKFRAKE